MVLERVDAGHVELDPSEVLRVREICRRRAGVENLDAPVLGRAASARVTVRRGDAARTRSSWASLNGIVTRTLVTPGPSARWGRAWHSRGCVPGLIARLLAARGRRVTRGLVPGILGHDGAVRTRLGLTHERGHPGARRRAATPGRRHRGHRVRGDRARPCAGRGGASGRPREPPATPARYDRHPVGSDPRPPRLPSARRRRRRRAPRGRERRGRALDGARQGAHPPEPRGGHPAPGGGARAPRSTACGPRRGVSGGLLWQPRRGAPDRGQSPGRRLPARGGPRVGGRGRPGARGRDPRRPPALRAHSGGAGGCLAADSLPVPTGHWWGDRGRPAVLERIALADVVRVIEPRLFSTVSRAP